MRPSEPTSRCLLALIAVLVGRCATTQKRMAQVSSTSRRAVRGEEFHIVAGTSGAGDAYDATLLFDRATNALRAHRFDAALADYDRLIREFPSARATPTAYYNRGVCLQAMNRPDLAADSFREAAARSSDASLTRDAWFRLAVVGEVLERPTVVISATDSILRAPRVTIADQIEALARQAGALLAESNREAALRTAERAISLAPTPEAVRALEDDTYIAQAKFIAAEVSRLGAKEIAIEVRDPQFERAIERKVQLVTHAHVLYNDAIRVGNPHWAAASGFSIGEMYRTLYEAIVNARPPADWEQPAIDLYRRRTGERLRPLLQGALRAWEATLAMAERTGIGDNDWVRRTQAQIDQLRNLVLHGF